MGLCAGGPDERLRLTVKTPAPTATQATRSPGSASSVMRTIDVAGLTGAGMEIESAPEGTVATPALRNRTLPTTSRPRPPRSFCAITPIPVGACAVPRNPFPVSLAPVTPVPLRLVPETPAPLPLAPFTPMPSPRIIPSPLVGTKRPPVDPRPSAPAPAALGPKTPEPRLLGPRPPTPAPVAAPGVP